jgi:formylglycine-generating enzyme required for sulfatase activity
LILGGLALGALALVGVGLTVVMLLNSAAAPPATSAPTAAPTVPASTAAALPTSAPTTAPTTTSTLEPTPPPTPEAGAEEVSTIDGMSQVYVPAGEFVMGNNSGPADQQSEHVVFLESFWIDQYEVTNAQYALCVAARLCTPPQRLDSITRAQYYGVPEFENFPVIYVSWFQAREYCEWAGRRLPTEAEWEKAARGDDRRLYPWGNSTPTAEQLNFRASGFGDTVAGYSYVANVSPYNAVDMSGNVSEWVEDFYDPNYYSVSPRDNPTGPTQTGCPGGDCRVLRGGNWNGTAEEVTTTFRLFYGPNDSRDAFGIRCARTP